MQFYIMEADALVARFGTRHPGRIARELGIDLVGAPLRNLYGVSICCDGLKAIVVNVNLSRAGQVLVVAHELGHLVLHPNGNFLYVWSATRLGTREEYQATMFAFRLLFGQAAEAEWVAELAASGPEAVVRAAQLADADLEL